VLAAQKAGDLGAESTEHEALGVDNVPFTLDLTCFRSVRSHAAVSRVLVLGAVQ